MSAHGRRSRLTALLGPTNTGKTHLAIERMLDYPTGMIGFPLRLLARENYDRVVRRKGARDAALVTGEEKIVPGSARYFLCTVESMPLDRPVDFLAIDEIQMCADLERGHVFTDRLLRARGTAETMFLGSDSMRAILRALTPEAAFVSRPRLSRLSHTAPRKIARLPPRSAVVAFSADRVYEIAEAVRRQRGGAAVVLGALSPRTRNAQVGMYQSGEVDYLVATDAIGMGLNMNVDHVAFHALTKFDGRARRRLAAAEIAQIAGRAGRHMNDGTFGTVAGAAELEPGEAEAIENHRFDAARAIRWRNPELDFRSPAALLASLDARPPRAALTRAREADDQRALAVLVREPRIAALARHPEAVRLLWDVCRIPDFRKTMAEAHTRFLTRVYTHLADGRLPTDWVADQTARLDRVDGDIDTLMARIAHIRTWTYVSHRAEWLDDARHWRQRARKIEDRLSDALHDRLTQRFVDRRAAALGRLKDRSVLAAAVTGDGEVTVEGQLVGRLDGFRFTPDAADTAEGRRAVLAAANRALRAELAGRVARLASDGDDAFALHDDATIAWRGARVARLRRGGGVLAPQIQVTPGERLSAAERERVRHRLVRWLEAVLRAGLGPLFAIRDAELSGPARGLAFQLVESLGSFPRRATRGLTAGLTPADRRAFRRLGVRIGTESIFVPILVKPRAARLRALLWTVHRGKPARPPPAPGLRAVAPDSAVEAAFYDACGYRVVGGRAIRVDVLDRLAGRLARAGRNGPFALSPDILSGVGLPLDRLAPVLRALGYEEAGSGRPGEYVRARRRNGRGRPPRDPASRRAASSRDTPFAKLQERTAAG